ncbi:MAG: hypothetical protein EZS28_036114 [Streblomastix strix]|uniref:Uncharacterized protein n=1 Tax=Streblomastix strix TaxID=222440 RepID=A0A5J4UDT5_9EUKA|nr:MAG: hypothetical protein EZS28_036114 [Streblomastix strix]
MRYRIGQIKKYVFATTDEMNTWMQDQENVAKLAIGDNYYIVDKQVMDYWQNGTGFRALETELTDRSNVMTIIGAATRGCNAITDLSFSANSSISAKNSSFITNNYDETITGQKIFNTTIHSVEIMVQNYENNSAVCAEVGIKAIQNINASIDLSYYYNKSQTYSQTETNNMLNNKLNISDQIDTYTKNQDDTLLFLKADKTELIDAYNKTEVNALFDDKLNISDQIDAFTKTQDDALLLLKANQSTTYTKIETDQFISQIDRGDIDLTNYYTKTNTNEFFDEKAATTNLSNYMTLGTDDTVLLFVVGRTEPISEFATTIDE